MSLEATPPESHADSEISCATCVAACCRAGTLLALSDTEAYRQRRQMNLKSILKAKNYPQVYPVKGQRLDSQGMPVPVRMDIPLPARYGFYILLTDCGNIAPDNSCKDYDNRPLVCQQYEMGSDECMAARAHFGLDGHTREAPIETTEPIQVNIPRYQRADPSAPPFGW